MNNELDELLVALDELDLGPNENLDIYQKGVSLLKDNKLEDSISYLREATNRLPASAEIWTKLGEACFKLAVNEGTVPLFSEALFATQRAIHLVESEQEEVIAEGKIIDYRDVPEYALAHYIMGLTYLEWHRDRNAALRNYERLRRLNPELAESLKRKIERK